MRFKIISSCLQVLGVLNYFTAQCLSIMLCWEGEWGLISAAQSTHATVINKDLQISNTSSELLTLSCTGVLVTQSSALVQTFDFRLKLGLS